MQPRECRDRLARLIAEESGLLTELTELLNLEHGYLVGNDVGALEKAAPERQRCVSRIFRVDAERRTLCSLAGQSLDPQGLQKLMSWCDPSGSLTPAWSNCTAIAARCRVLNDRNGALVAARLKHVQERLGTLIEGRRDAVTYGPRGARAHAVAGRVLAAEA